VEDSLMFVVAADIGQARDPTAIVGLEVTVECFDLRHLERLPLGTPYPLVADRLGVVCDAVPSPRELVVDATGVGRPVVDLLRSKGRRPVAVLITGSGSETFKPETGTWSVPKRLLMAPLGSALELGRLRLSPGLPVTETEALRRELSKFFRQINGHGHTVMGGKREHDDTVIAVALAVWWAHHDRYSQRHQIGELERASAQ
jgi:hypothetical protein